MIICWINKGSCYLAWSEPPVFLCQSVSLPKLKFDNFDMSEIELKHYLNHWIVRVRRVFDPAGGCAAGPLVQPFSSMKAKIKFRWFAQGHTPLNFEHIQGANSLASQCRITVMVKIILWYCSVSCCNVLVLVLCSSGACPCLLHTLR